MKKCLLAVLAIMVLGTTANFVEAKVAKTSPATASAIKFYKSGNYTQAYATLTTIVEKDPSDALAAYYLGMSSAQLGKRDEAIANYQRAMELSPRGILGAYANKGKKCIETPEKCNDPITSYGGHEDTEEDLFIRGKFGSGFSSQARGEFEKQKIDSLKREINRSNDISPNKFRDYKDFSSQGPSDAEIVHALRTLQSAGLTNVYGTDFSGGNNNIGYDVFNLLNGRNTGSANLNPQLIQSLLTNQMTTNF